MHQKNNENLLLFLLVTSRPCFLSPIQYNINTFWPHMGADFFPEGGKNAPKFEVPPKMALAEGILFPCVGEG